MNEKKIKIAVDVDLDFADSITVQNLKDFYEAMMRDTDDDSVELRMHVKYTLQAFMTQDEFEEYMDYVWEKDFKKKTFREEDNDD